MKKIILYIIVSVVCFSCVQKSKSVQKELLIFSAASLINVVTEIAEQYESVHNTDIQLNFASSGTLARQIEHGAEPSVYISANEKWIDYLIDNHLIAKETKLKLVGNSLAVIVPIDSPIESLSIENNFAEAFKGRLAIGDPKHVPAGDYAWQAIENAGYGKKLEGRILATKDVRSALMVVEMGEVEMGIVYKTDALKSQKVKIVSEISSGLHSSIGFYASVLKEKNNEQTMLFYNFLNSNKAKSIWIKHGFKIE
jgi:molybdate transport system substrate-binding protein